jgi:16S rRNA (uracil1498-N3)-methyltransferase
MKRTWRAYHPGLEPRAGSRLVLDDAEAHHVSRVLRLPRGADLGVFDGRGNEWRATVTAVGRRVEVELLAPVDGAVEAPLEVRLFQGLCRADRMEWLIQKATEVGVAAVIGVAALGAETKPPGPGRLERWRRIAVEACKQSGRRAVPGIDVVDGLPDPPPQVAGLLLVPGESPALGSRLEELERPAAVWLAVGAEAGIGPQEVERHAERGWRRSGLGPRILRAETAGLVAAAIVLHRRGDLGAERAVDSPRSGL